MKTNRYLILVFLLISSACLNDEVEPAAEPNQDKDFDVIQRPLEFKHRFANVPLQDGKIPFIEVKDSADGKRFGFQDRAGQEASGGAQYDSVLAQFETREIPADEMAAMRNEKYGGERARSGPRPVVKADTATIMAASPDKMFDVLIRVDEPERIQVKRELDRAVALGEVTSWSEYQTERDRLKALDRAEIKEILEPVVEHIRAAGIDVVYQCRGMYCLGARLEGRELAALAAIPAVKKIDLAATNATNQSVAGTDVIDGLQLEQFLPENGGSTTLRDQQVHDGENFPSTKDFVDIRLSIIDQKFPEGEHLGFREGTGTSDRLDAQYDCTGFFSCFSISNPAESAEGAHATEVLGLALGDVRDEQEGAPGVPNGLTPEQDRSGYAGEAKAFVYAAGTSQTNSRNAMDHIVSKSGTQPSVVVMSIGSETGDTDCSGDHAADEDANDLFEDDKLLFFAAGNEGGTSSDCRVEQPGSAIGVFTVGARGAASDSGTEAGVRNAGISSDSAWGGNSTQGSNRSIIDVAAYGCRKFMFDTALGYGTAGCGTSYAAPTAAASMISYIDWYINRSGWTDIRTEPGFVHANALLMGDRRQTTGYFNTGYSNRLGAGAIEMRRFQSKNMDSPWGFASGDVCVDDSQTVTIPINSGNTLSSDVDDLKAVAWWYDKNHEDGWQIDDIDLALYRTNGTALRIDGDTADEKERVYHGGVGGNAVELRLTGQQVTNDHTICGSNSMRVYYAYFYEDDDRDDVDGPSSAEIEAEGT